MKIRIIENHNYTELAPLFKKSGLEVDVTKAPADVVTCWKAVAEESKEDDTMPAFLGGVSIEHRKGEFVLGDIAVEEAYRDLDIGTSLLETAVDRIRELGGKEIYLVAKAPKFFAKYGFKGIDRSEAPDIFSCLSCDQFQVTCHPEVMKRKLL